MDDTEKFYWMKVGYMAHSFGMPPDSEDGDVLAHEQATRAAAQGLSTDTSWFQIFCAELKAGVEPAVPDYCECGDVDWFEDPKRAINPAKLAAEVFLARSEKVA